jgi:hypothetical protein
MKKWFLYCLLFTFICFQARRSYSFDLEAFKKVLTFENLEFIKPYATIENFFTGSLASALGIFVGYSFFSTWYKNNKLNQSKQSLLGGKNSYIEVVSPNSPVLHSNIFHKEKKVKKNKHTTPSLQAVSQQEKEQESSKFVNIDLDYEKKAWDCFQKYKQHQRSNVQSKKENLTINLKKPAKLTSDVLKISGVLPWEELYHLKQHIFGLMNDFSESFLVRATIQEPIEWDLLTTLDWYKGQIPVLKKNFKKAVKGYNNELRKSGCLSESAVNDVKNSCDALIQWSQKNSLPAAYHLMLPEPEEEHLPIQPA